MVTTLKISGMSCAHCTRAVFTALSGVPGIARADVRIGTAEVEHDGTVTLDALKQAVETAGYSVIDADENRRVLPQL
ncbi:MAG: cation transporter [Gemmatimonadaceae bacterium]|nr:cation transporter [Gemmatimonadaceae bacterium]